MGAGGKGCPGLMVFVREVAFGEFGVAHLQLPAFRRQSLSEFPSARLYPGPGDGGREKRLCEGAQWSPPWVQS